MLIYDEHSRLPIGDPGQKPFPPTYSAEQPQRMQALSRFILSASGWRKVFAEDGSEESRTSEIRQVDKELVARAALVYSTYLEKQTTGGKPIIAVGCDTRYTGPTIADIVIRTLVSREIHVRYLFIVAAPELMAYTRLEEAVGGFVYISASHNPIGHNGIKFGNAQGSVIGGDASKKLIEMFTTSVEQGEDSAQLCRRINAVSGEAVQQVFEQVSVHKQQAIAHYTRFSQEVIADSSVPSVKARFFDTIRDNTHSYPLGVVAELNGSARTLSIDEFFLQEAGIAVKGFNTHPREIAHCIVPEGEGLTLCKRELERAYVKDKRYLFGYVPDNDGDRGNIVYIDTATGEAKPLEAQQVFALACMAELATLVYNGTITYDPELRIEQNLAVAVNGPTSLRIERIAETFGASVYRAEVGEANVVNLAAGLREDGFIVRILGEGSNGGNITHPSSMRDPLNTLFCLLKLLLLRDSDSSPGLFSLWCSLSGQEARFRPDYSLEDIIATLPRFSTTSAYESRAKLQIASEDHRLLKATYEDIFRREYEQKQTQLRERFGIYSWEACHYEGTETFIGEAAAENNRSGRGGYKIVFRNQSGREVAFLWMRGSGTEPVFRVIADVEGDKHEDEVWLLAWHTAMIEKADQHLG